MRPGGVDMPSIMESVLTPPSVPHPFEHVDLRHAESDLAGNIIRRNALFEKITCPSVGLTTAIGEFLPLPVGSGSWRIDSSAGGSLVCSSDLSGIGGR